jgi:excisionase family DNA binding protein
MGNKNKSQSPSNQNQDSGEYLTPDQVAKLLQVREFTVRLWLRRGLLKGIKLGNRSGTGAKPGRGAVLWRIPRKSLEEFTELTRHWDEA